jgi:SAM-dependent methyltransferase
MEDYTNLFDGEAAAAASTWDKQIASGRYIRGEVFLSAALKSVPRGGYILDYGCGPGRISALLARTGFRVSGVILPAPCWLWRKTEPRGTGRRAPALFARPEGIALRSRRRHCLLQRH